MDPKWIISGDADKMRICFFYSLKLCNFWCYQLLFYYVMLFLAENLQSGWIWLWIIAKQIYDHRESIDYNELLVKFAALGLDQKSLLSSVHFFSFLALKLNDVSPINYLLKPSLYLKVAEKHMRPIYIATLLITALKCSFQCKIVKLIDFLINYTLIFFAAHKKNCANDFTLL